MSVLLSKSKEARRLVAGLMARKGKRLGKYRNVRTTSGDGVEHASKKQSLRWVLLRQMEREGKIRNLRREVTYRLEVRGQLICKYVADHVFEALFGWPHTTHIGSTWETIVEDVKSPITRKNRAYRMKCKLMAAIHGITIKEV